MDKVSRSTSLNNRLAALGKNSHGLTKDLAALEGALYLMDDQGVQGILRKEIGGSRWQHGGEGKVLGYKSTKDLNDKYGLQATKAQHARPASAKKKATGTAPSRMQSNKQIGTSRACSAPADRKTKYGTTTTARAQTGAQMKAKESAQHTQVLRSKSAVPSGGVSEATPGGNIAISPDPPLRALSIDLDLPSPGELSSVSDTESGDQLFDPKFATRSFEERSGEMRAKVLRKVMAKIDRESLESSFGKESDLKSSTTMSSESPRQQGCDPEVYSWLKSLNLKDTERYAKLLADNEIDIDSLKLVSESQLRQIGITGIGPLNKMLFAIKDLRGENSDIETFVKAKQGPQAAKNSGSSKKGAQSQRAVKVPLTLDVQGSNIGNLSSRSGNASLESPTKVKAGGSDMILKTSIRNKDQRVAARKPAADSKTQGRPKSSRPVSGSVLIASPRKANARRPASAKTHSTGRQSGRGDSEVKTPEDMSPLDERDLTVSDFISVRTMMADVPAEVTLLEEHGGDACTLSHGITANDMASPLDRLTEIESHVSGLQKELENPLAMDLIEKLQAQLQQVQHTLARNKASPPLDVLSDVPQSSMPVHRQEELIAGQTLLFDPDMPFLESQVSSQSRKPISVPPQRQAVASLAMSKAQLLKEVRKQKDQHRKQIRHLEAELSRLKYKDPLRSCEIPVEDFSFNENGVLGEGAFSQVFHGFYQGSEVAIKRLKIPLSSQDKNYFAAEVSLLRELRHPRVVLLLGVNTTSHLPLMMLEYMSGGSLYHFLHNPNRESLDHAAYYQVARDTALGMNYLHGHRPAVLHLDLKSMNILLTGDLRAKIGDFGFSKLRHDAEQTSKDKKLKGTPAWMSPELLDTGEISTKADVYSFGIILWEMLTRRRPYEGVSMFQVIQHARNNRRPEIPEDCPDELRHVITSCWAQNPAKRPPFKDIVSELEKLHFPQEWRVLFTVSGVPAEALDDVHATRSIINLVYDTIEEVRPEGVPTLDLNDSEENKPKLYDFPSSDSSGSLDALPVAAPEPVVRSGRTGRVAWSEEYDQQQPPAATASAPIPKPVPSSFTLPPPPPVPPLDMSSFMDAQAPTRKTTSFLDDIKSGMKNISLKPAGLGHISEEQTTHGGKGGKGIKGKARDAGMDLRASQLLAQRGQLRATEQPHPNQLRPLGGVSEAKLHDLAEVLRKAVSDRRIAMNVNDPNSIDQTLTHSGWSITD